jgi:hypothetical protein
MHQYIYSNINTVFNIFQCIAYLLVCVTAYRYAVPPAPNKAFMTSDIVVHKGEVGTIRHFDVESGKFEVRFKHSNESLHLLPEEFTRLKTFMENQKQEDIKTKEKTAAAEQGTRQLLINQESSTTLPIEDAATTKVAPSCPIDTTVAERKDANVSHMMSVLVDDKVVAGHITEDKGNSKTFRSAKI